MRVEIIEFETTSEMTALCDLYIKNGDGIILIYPVASRETFNDIVYRREQILRVHPCEDVPVALVGIYGNYDEKPRVVSTEQGKEMAERLNCSFFEVDINDSDQVEEVFNSLLPMALDCREERKKQEKEKDRDCVVM